MALLTVLGMKLIWRADTRGIGSLKLLMWAYLAALLAYVGAWAYTGAEGSMLGYGLMVSATAVALWLRAFVWRA